MELVHTNLQVSKLEQNNYQANLYLAKYQDEQSAYKYILKVYDQQQQIVFEQEKLILQKLQQNKFIGFPQIVSFASNELQHEILMERLGLNMKSLKISCPQMSIQSKIKIIQQLLFRFQDLHSIDFIHNDIKLENILIGNEDPDVIYLIDFGIAQRFNKQNGQHIKRRFIGKFTGNILFASLNSCKGNSKSRKDDLESLLYLMGYLINNNLPWRDLEYDPNEDFDKFLQIRCEKEMIQQFVSDSPQELRSMLSYVYGMKFNQDPDYDFLQNQLIIFLNKINLQMNHLEIHNFEWIKHHHKKHISSLFSNNNQECYSEQNKNNQLYQKYTEDNGQDINSNKKSDQFYSKFQFQSKFINRDQVLSKQSEFRVSQVDFLKNQMSKCFCTPQVKATEEIQDNFNSQQLFRFKQN